MARKSGDRRLLGLFPNLNMHNDDGYIAIDSQDSACRPTCLGGKKIVSHSAQDVTTHSRIIMDRRMGDVSSRVLRGTGRSSG